MKKLLLIILLNLLPLSVKAEAALQKCNITGELLTVVANLRDLGVKPHNVISELRALAPEHIVPNEYINKATDLAYTSYKGTSAEQVKAKYFEECMAGVK